MNSDRLTRWLTLGANLGVLAGIILILFELNQNADLMRAQMIQARTDQITAKYDGMIHSEFWPEIWAKRRSADSDHEWIASLTRHEYERVRYYYFREYEDLRSQYYQYVEGYVSEQYWQSAIRGQIVRMIRLIAALDETWDEETRKKPFPTVIIQIAKEDGLATPNSEGAWTD
jgi:hypothetical protein